MAATTIVVAGLEGRYDVRSTVETTADTATPERILESARHLFRERGVRRTRMSDIAEGAGVVRQTVYDWVSSRSEIVDLAMAARVRELGEEVKAMPVDESLPLRDQLLEVLMTMARLAGTDPEAEIIAQAMPEQHAFLFMSGPSALTDVVVDILRPTSTVRRKPACSVTISAPARSPNGPARGRLDASPSRVGTGRSGAQDGVLPVAGDPAGRGPVIARPLTRRGQASKL